MTKKVRTRFAPSPTGYLHIGGLRAALFEYAYAKTYEGDFVLRIEDTDRKRYVEGSVKKLISTLKLFGINWDEGPGVGGPHKPYIQSERMKKGLFKKYAEKLVEQGNAYYCFCEARTKEDIEKDHETKGAVVRDPCREFSVDDAKKRIKNGETGAIRLRVSDTGEVSFKDIVLKKRISWKLEDVDEAMLLKSDGYPTYHLGVVVDDVEMGITHILRGFEWLPSTPIHLLLFKYLDYDLPEIGHFSLILDPDGGKLSKRKRNVSCEEYVKKGYLPEALLNYIMLLGWAPKDNREIYTLKEYVKEFNNGNLQVANAVFNPDKLDWFNQQYIQESRISDLVSRIYLFFNKKYDPKLIEKIAPYINTRIKTLKEFETIAGFFFKEPKVNKKLFGENHKNHLSKTLDILDSIENWNLETINEKLMGMIKKNDFHTGKFFMDFRIAITGNKFTPPINESIEILGKEETINRLKSIVG